MFESFEMAPADPILGLTEAFKKDPNPGKINLGVGVYKDENDHTPIFASVKKAEERLLATETTKSYLPIPGAPEYGAAVQSMVFGQGHEIVTGKRAVTAHTPGGTGALRVAGEFLKTRMQINRIWLSNPTWENHVNVFKAAGLEIGRYPYYDAANKKLDFEALCTALKDVPKGDAVLFHASCHNPSGMDPDFEQWRAMAALVEAQGLVPVFDFAYQGLGDGLEEDAAGLRLFCKPGAELLIASSFSKNFGLYNERVGALTIVAGDADAAQKAFSHLKQVIRANYSSPSAHGAAIVSTVLGDAALKAMWEGEVRAMCGRIQSMRRLFVDTLKAKGAATDFSFLIRQKGMFSFSGLSKEQVLTLRGKYAIYIVDSGRINVAGMTPGNMDALCSAIAEVLKDS